MNQIVRDTAERIKRLEVQGARNVAIAAIKALQASSEQTNTQTKTAFLEELIEAQSVLFASRETEPLMRNAVHWIITQAQETTRKKLSPKGNGVFRRCLFLQNLEASRERTAEIGAKRIRDGMLVFTHCHSSTVTRTIAKAKEMEKVQRHLH